MKTGTPEAKYATSPRSRTTATTALISWAPAGGVGKCSCVGIDPPGFGDAQTITHHTPEHQANKPGPLPMSGVLNLDRGGRGSRLARQPAGERMPSAECRAGT